MHKASVSRQSWIYTQLKMTSQTRSRRCPLPPQPPPAVPAAAPKVPRGDRAAARDAEAAHQAYSAGQTDVPGHGHSHSVLGASYTISYWLFVMYWDRQHARMMPTN